MSKATKGDAFGLDNTPKVDADPADFDLDAWLSGATLPTRSVTVYKNAGLRAEFDRIADEYQQLEAEQASGDAERIAIGDAAMGEMSAEATLEVRLHDIAERMQQVRAELVKDPMRVTVRGVTLDEHEAAIKASDGDQNSLTFEILSRAGVTPAGATPEQWRQVRNRIGQKQFEDIVAALNDANGWGGASTVVPPFSPSASERLATPQS